MVFVRSKEAFASAHSNGKSSRWQHPAACKQNENCIDLLFKPSVHISLCKQRTLSHHSHPSKKSCKFHHRRLNLFLVSDGQLFFFPILLDVIVLDLHRRFLPVTLHRLCFQSLQGGNSHLGRLRSNLTCLFAGKVQRQAMSA